MLEVLYHLAKFGVAQISPTVELSDEKESSITTTDDIWRVRVDLGSAIAHQI